jgi:hypothetical protein
VRVRGEDWRRMLVMALMSAPGVAFVFFDFIFPNLTTPSLDKNMLVLFLLAIIFGMPSGYLTRRTDLAILTVLLYVIIGYVLAIVAYSAPFTVYDFSVIFPGLYFMFFVNMTVIPLLIIVLGGFIGVILGQLLGESMDREETAQNFSK